MEFTEKIQKLFLKRRMIVELYKIKYILNDLDSLINNSDKNLFATNSDENAFDKLTTYIKNVTVIQHISFFLNKFYRFNKPNTLIAKKITARQFLSLYIFVGYPKYSLNNKHMDEDHIEKDMYEYSKKLYTALKCLLSKQTNEPIRLFTKCLNQYSNVFALFINEDKVSKANELAIRWNHLDKTIDDINKSSSYDLSQKEQILIELQKDKQYAEEIIKKLVPEFNLSNLQILKKISNVYETTIHKCFWESVVDDISNEKYDIVVKIFQDIKNELLALNSTEKFKRDIDNNISIEHIQLLLDNKCFDFQEILNIANYTIGTLKNICAPAKIKIIENEWANIYKLITEKQTSFAEIGKIIFRFILDQIMDIKNDILNCMILQSIGINPLLLK